MSFKLEMELVVERLRSTNSPAVFWPKRRLSRWWIMGFNFSPLVVRLCARVVRWQENLHRER